VLGGNLCEGIRSHTRALDVVCLEHDFNTSGQQAGLRKWILRLLQGTANCRQR
jgi:hypothetical protein